MSVIPGRFVINDSWSPANLWSTAVHGSPAQGEARGDGSKEIWFGEATSARCPLRSLTGKAAHSRNSSDAPPQDSLIGDAAARAKITRYMEPKIRVLGRGEAGVLSRVAMDVFDHAVNPRWTAEFFADPRHHLVVAQIDGEVVGMASAVHYVHPDKPPELWVNEVGVALGYRNRGIGRKLLAALFAKGRELGCSEAWLGTEESNMAARRMYARAGGREEPMVYVTFTL